MRHIVQERSLCTACILRRIDRILQLLIDLLVLGPVRQIQNVFLLTLNVRAEHHHTEPQLLAGLLMDILPVPLPLLAGQNG